MGQGAYVPSIVALHDPPPNDGRPERRERNLRNALWVAWLRRPPGAAIGHTLRLLRGSPRDRYSARGAVRALGGLPWVLRERRVSPPHVDANAQVLEAR